MKIKPYIPIYCRDKNKLIRFDYRPFKAVSPYPERPVMNGGTIKVAIYYDKKGKVQEMDSIIYWGYPPEVYRHGGGLSHWLLSTIPQ